MKEKVNEETYDILTPGCFILEKSVWEKYNMILTKTNVELFLKEYNESKIICLKSIICNKMTSVIDPNKIFRPSVVNDGGHAKLVNDLIDAEQIINNTEPVLQEIIKTFTPKEKIYYEYCLLSDYSEEYVMNMLDIHSKKGLKPFKNSCLLKFALVFGIAVLK